MNTWFTADLEGVEDFDPILLLEVDLAHPIPDVLLISPENEWHYRRAVSLVRAYTYPVGYVHFALDSRKIGAADYARMVWDELKTEITAYLQRNGLPAISTLDVAGLSMLQAPPYIKEREELLKRAPFVSVVVTTRDRPDSLAQTLHSLGRIVYPNYEIVVVDNAPLKQPSDRLVAELAEEIPGLRYVREDRAGLCWARNCGLEAADGEITVFTDDDVLADPNWLTALVEGFNASDNVIAAQTKTTVPETHRVKQEWFKLYPRAYPFMQECMAVQSEYVEDIFGRKMRLPDANIYGPTHVNTCKINYPVQGSTASINKRALLYIMDNVSGEDIRLQVHDEFVNDGPIVFPKEIDEIYPGLVIPFEVKEGPKWS